MRLIAVSPIKNITTLITSPILRLLFLLMRASITSPRQQPGLSEPQPFSYLPLRR